jgi:serine/threonine protein kinase
VNAPCPPAQTLRQYAIGDIDEAAGDQIEQHLAACSTCEDSVARFDTAEDSLMRHLPLAAGQSLDDPADPPGWLCRLRSGPPAAGTLEIPSLERNGESGPLAEFSAYEPLRVLGRGGMGVVYRARHRQLNRNVALKVLSPRLMATPEARRRFEREIQILGGLQHPGIVMATDAGRIGGAAYLVMELIDGVDLARIVRETGPLTVAEACEAARQMAEALAAAHQAGTVHRDVKPSNAMVDRQGRVKLLDFGLAHLAVLSAETLETSLGRLLGTLDYMAPEQAGAEQPLDGRADLYGLGATLFYLLTGRPPHGTHTRRSLLDQLRALAAAEAPRVSSLRADVPVDLDEFIAALLSRDPAARPDSAKTVADELSKWAGGDLAARVEEVDAHGCQDEPSADDSEAARRSLSELLGIESSGDSPDAAAPPATGSATEAARSRTARRWAWLALATVAIGVVAWGVTILLQTPEGTLRIESEVNHVRIELVDEQNRTRELQVERGETETTLRAGRYKVRLAGGHDGIAIDQDVITLRRGDEVVARITRSAKAAAGDADDTRAAAERLYQGRSESEWQRLFEAETAPLAKLQAAQALFTLAAARPPDEFLDRALDIGSTLMESAFGDRHLDSPLLRPFDQRALRLAAWPLADDKQLGTAFRQTIDSVAKQMSRIPPQHLAGRLGGAIVGSRPYEASFAMRLIQEYGVRSHIEQDEAALGSVLAKLDVPLDSLDRTVIPQFLRVAFYPSASATQQQAIVSDLNALGVALRKAPADEFTSEMRSLWLDVAARLPLSAETAAEFLLQDLPQQIENRFQSRWFGDELPYADAWAAQAREGTKFFLEAWIPTVNAYLKDHADDPLNAPLAAVLKSLDYTLRLYFEEDDWDVEMTAALLTERLRRFYSTGPDAADDQLARDLRGETPAMLLVQITRMTGEIPEFVRDGQPRSAAVRERLAHFQRVLESGPSRKQFYRDEVEELEGLIEVAPYHAIRLAVGENNFDKSPPDNLSPISIDELLYAISSPKVREARLSREELPPTDPMLLLAVLADLVGESAAQDDRIAQIFGERRPNPSRMLTRHLDDILSGPWKMKAVVRRLLGRMADRAKSEKLIEAIRKLDPTVVQNRS